MILVVAEPEARPNARCRERFPSAQRCNRVRHRLGFAGAGTVQFGTAASGHGNGDQAFWAGRVDDGVSPTRVMAVTLRE